MSYGEKKFSDIDMMVAAIIASATLSHSSRKTIFRLAVNKHIICVHTSLLRQAGAYLKKLLLLITILAKIKNILYTNTLAFLLVKLVTKNFFSDIDIKVVSFADTTTLSHSS
jgi:hypothetical protein